MELTIYDDEEQTRTALVDAAEQKCHTHNCSKVKEREKEHTNRFTWFTLNKATSTGGKTENFYY